MLEYTDLKPGMEIVLDNYPFVVLEYSFVRKQQRKPVVQTKLRNLITGQVVERGFYPRDQIKEAEIEKKDVKFLYSNRGEAWFCPPDNPADRFNLKEPVVGGLLKFMKPNLLVTAVYFGGEIINIELPIKVELKVVEAPPAVRGNTAQGVTKQVKVETEMFLNVPIFINEGDILRINTQSGEYVERVEKNK